MQPGNVFTTEVLIKQLIDSYNRSDPKQAHKRSMETTGSAASKPSRSPRGRGIGSVRRSTAGWLRQIATAIEGSSA